MMRLTSFSSKRQIMRLQKVDSQSWKILDILLKQLRLPKQKATALPQKKWKPMQAKNTKTYAKPLE